MKNDFKIYVQVYVDIQKAELNKPFTYGVPGDMANSLFPGCAVKAPFGNRTILGYVTDISPFPPSLPKNVTIKPIIEVIPTNSLWDREMVELAGWIESYYGTNFVSALKVLVPGPVRVQKDGTLPGIKKIKKVLLKMENPEEKVKLKKRAPAQYKVLEFLKKNPGVIPLSELINATGAPYSSIQGLEKKGYVEVFQESPRLKYFHPYRAGSQTHLKLTADQHKVYEGLLELLETEKMNIALLHGITGSGKTEIYLQLIDQALKSGKEALVLVPEISLTPQAIQRFKSRFSEEIAVLHSRMTPTERRQMWWNIKNKKVRVVLGARSAVFAPLENIGIIVVDEEHESSYKQESEPRYHARQVAIKRAITHDALVILGSATPSLDAYYRVRQGVYHLFELPRRVGQSKLPDIIPVDLKKDYKSKDHGILGETLKTEMSRIIAKGEQAILFLNRRGFSSFLLCLECGNVIKCPYCDVTLTYHKIGRALKCHHCDYQRPAPDICPFCRGIKIVTPSHGIQKVEEEIDQLFPGIKKIRMDRDTTKGRDAHRFLLEKFARREASVLIGTQMIAKGLDFPGVTLVGVILADISLNMPDFHSLENTYQLLTQVAGRAGRREAPGKVIIQTYNPGTPVIKAVQLQNYEDFFNWELSNREKLNYPPFSHLINIILTGEINERVRDYALLLADVLSNRNLRKNFISVLGPAPCPLSRVKSRYRWHLMLKCRKIPRAVAIVRAVVKKFSVPSGVTFSMDVDPISIM